METITKGSCRLIVCRTLLADIEGFAVFIYLFYDFLGT